jgi:hypothetical protein
MGVLYDYFAAPSDEAAAATIDRLGGPGSQKVAAVPDSKPARRGLFSRKGHSLEPEPANDEALPSYDTLSVKGIDPLVQLGTLEECLTGRSYDDVIEDPRSGKSIASADGGERLVLTITDSLAAALAGASDERLSEVAVPWSQTEEFWGEADPEELAEFLRDFAALARRAEGVGQRLYCWLCV